MASDLHSNRLAGGCQCGAVRYEIHGEPVSLFVCQCRECQKQSASAFGISVIIKRSALRVIQGEVKVWSRATDSGVPWPARSAPSAARVCGTKRPAQPA